jgi:phage baseplate assembly protein V
MSPRDLKQQILKALGSVRLPLRGRLRRLTDSRIALAQVEGMGGETFQDAEYLQQAGLRSRPLAGAEVLIIPLGGASAHGVVVSCANGKLHVAALKDGETALYNETDGHFIHLKNGRVIRIECDTLEIVANIVHTGNVQQTGDIQQTGSMVSTGTHKASEVSNAAGVVLGTHKHSGVRAGSNDSGAPKT